MSPNIYIFAFSQRKPGSWESKAQRGSMSCAQSHSKPATDLETAGLSFPLRQLLFFFSLSKMIPPGKGSTMPNVTNKKKLFKEFFLE